jgi:hypothetical protein
VRLLFWLDSPDPLNAGGVMSKRSDLWHQAQVCMSLARATDDPLLKERYEDLAVDLVRNAEREQGFDDKTRRGASRVVRKSNSGAA